MRSDIAPGAPFPNYELRDHTGTYRRLSELQGPDPMIIVLAREAYSAKDQVQQRNLAQLWSDQKVPHTMVCEPGLSVYKIYNGYWFVGRPTNEELRHDLRTVLLKRHWDWDLSRPEVLAAWEGGERERFYAPQLGWGDLYS